VGISTQQTINTIDIINNTDLNGVNMINMIKRVVIIGHTGFIGSKIEQALRKNYPQVEIRGLSYPSFDIASEAEKLKEHFDAETAVIMLAAVKKQFGDSIDHCQKNIAMAVNLCRALQEQPVARVIYFSSAEVYGHFQHQVISEETAVQPSSYYGIAKYAAERMLLKAAPQNLIILRPPQIYGPGDLPCYGPSGFLQEARSQEPIVLWGEGEEKREFIFVEDVAALVQKLVFSEHSGILNVTSGVSYSYQEVLEIIKKQLPSSSSSFLVASKPRTSPQADFYFNNQKLKEFFPSFRFTTLSEGIENMNMAIEKIE